MNHRNELQGKQTSLFNEIIVDNFAGGGGASTGIELALGRPVDIAINHDPAAILMHKTNHPHTVHYQESVWDIDPRAVCGGRKVGLAWFSPDCRHFSKASGAALKDKKIRGLAWIVCRWAGLVRPRVIILENVEEFTTWGPARKGKPRKSKAGNTFRKFITQLESPKLGYQVEYRELVAADYGAPTTRKRFFLIARCDGRPIVWPERTHAPADSADVRSRKCLPWRSAAEIIDWSLPCPSIFDDKATIKAQYGLDAKRPLVDNTMRRIARGLDKFVIRSGNPFIIQGYSEAPKQNPRVHDICQPVPTAVGSAKQRLIMPVLSSITHSARAGGYTHLPNAPVNTVVSKAEQCIIAPALVKYHAEKHDYVRGQAVDRPALTVDGSNRFGLMGAALTKYYGQGTGQSVDTPMHTATAKDREGVNAVFLSKYFSGGYTGAGADVAEPLPTVTAWDHNAICATHIAEFKGQDKGQGPTTPLRTITASAGQFGAVKTYLAKADGTTGLHRWPDVRALLNSHCGYELADDEILLMEIGDALCYISDVGLRMLSPAELYRAQGFPDDYKIDRDHTGKAYTKEQQVARCGNAVPPPFARALAAANLPEYAAAGINTMNELEEVIAA